MTTKAVSPVKTPEQIQSDLVCASMEWVDLRDRVARTGERDAQLKAKRDYVMENMCRADGLLDQFIVINGLENGDGTK